MPEQQRSIAALSELSSCDTNTNSDGRRQMKYEPSSHERAIGLTCGFGRVGLAIMRGAAWTRDAAVCQHR